MLHNLKLTGCVTDLREVGIAANGYLIASADSITLAGDVEMLKESKGSTDQRQRYVQLASAGG